MSLIGYGVDFGTTNSVLAFSDGRTTTAIMDESTDLPHPSVVWYSGDGVVVGGEAKRNINQYGDQPGHRFVRSIKRKLGWVDSRMIDRQLTRRQKNEYLETIVCEECERACAGTCQSK